MEFKKTNRQPQRRPVPRPAERRPLPSLSPRSINISNTPAATPPSDGSSEPNSKPTQSSQKTINIHINFDGLAKIKRPTISGVRAKIKVFFSSRKRTYLLILGTVIIGAAGASTVIRHEQKVAQTQDSQNNTSEILENLEYQTVLPESKSITQLGGWKRVSPPDSDPVYAYTDKINDIAISVSQQPLPDSFKQGGVDGKVADLAKKFNATTSFDAGTTTAYIGTSAKGPQSVIFTKNSLLILIKSQANIDEAAWIRYVKSLN